MHLYRWSVKFLIVAALVLAPLSSFAGVFVSIGIAPPPLPVYDQPVCPDDGYLWTPGYWAYGDYGYYWVPGVWVEPPAFGLLWTPGYWGWGGGDYRFHDGYWGPHVGFYGGIDYGFGYGGNGYGGGRWQGGHFFYNSAYSHVDGANFHNTYSDRGNFGGGGSRNVSFNGGNGGVNAMPTAEDRQFAHEQHVHATSAQQEHVTAASRDRGQLAKVNGGKPATLAATRPDEYTKVAHERSTSQPLTDQDREKKGATGETGATGLSATHTDAVKSEGATEEKPKVKHEKTTGETGLTHEHKTEQKQHHTTAAKTHEGPGGGGQPHPESHGKPQGQGGGQGKSDKDKKH